MMMMMMIMMMMMTPWCFFFFAKGLAQPQADCVASGGDLSGHPGPVGFLRSCLANPSDRECHRWGGGSECYGSQRHRFRGSQRVVIKYYLYIYNIYIYIY